MTRGGGWGEIGRRGSGMSTSPEILLGRKFRFQMDFQISQITVFSSARYLVVGAKDRGLASGRCVIEVLLSSRGHHALVWLGMVEPPWTTYGMLCYAMLCYGMVWYGRVLYGHHNHHNCRQLLLHLIPRRCSLISQTKP